MLFSMELVQYNTTQHNTIRHNTSTIHYITILYNNQISVNVSLMMSLRSSMFTKLTVVSPYEGVTVLGLQLWAVKETA